MSEQRRRRGLGCQLLPIGLLLLGGLPQAQADISPIKDTTCPQVQPCRVHLQAATRFFTNHAYADALREFNNAYGEQPDPRLLLNIGRTHFMLDQPAEAMKYYKRCEEAAQLDVSLDNELRAKLTEYIEQAQLKLDAQKKQAELAAPVSKPQPALLPAAEPVPVPTSAPAQVTLTESAKPSASPLVSPAVESPVYKKWWFWGLVGVAAAGVGTSIGLGLRQNSTTTMPVPLGTVRFPDGSTGVIAKDAYVPKIDM